MLGCLVLEERHGTRVGVQWVESPRDLRRRLRSRDERGVRVAVDYLRAVPRGDRVEQGQEQVRPARNRRTEQGTEQGTLLLDLRTVFFERLLRVEAADFHLALSPLDVDLDEHTVAGRVDENLQPERAGLPAFPPFRLLADAGFAEPLNEVFFRPDFRSKD